MNIDINIDIYIYIYIYIYTFINTQTHLLRCIHSYLKKAKKYKFSILLKYLCLIIIKLNDNVRVRNVKDT